MSAFWVGFEKRAGLFQRIADKARSAITGTQRVYHGTSASRANEILNKGLKPNAKGGISHALPASAEKSVADMNKGLVFTTKDKGTAKSYAKQQTGLELVDKLHKTLRDYSDYKKKFYGKGEWTGNVASVLDEIPALKAMAAQHYVRIPFAPGGKVLKMDLPADLLKSRSVPNPEAALRLEQATKSPVSKVPILGRLLKYDATAPFKHDVAIKGKIDPKFIKE